MEELLQKSKIDYLKLRRFVHSLVSSELSKLVEPCHYPKLHKQYYEFLHICGLKEVDVKKFAKRFWVGRPESKWLLHRDVKTMFYIFIMFALLSERDQLAFSSMLTFCIVRNYTNLMSKQIKFCNVDVFKLSLERLARTHLFVREKTIPRALYFLSKELQRKYSSYFLSMDKDYISKFITESRTRMSQSVKSFAKTYYKVSEEGGRIKEPYEGEEDEYQYQQLQRSSKVIGDIVKKVTIYKVVDKKAIAEARKLSKVSSQLASLMSNNLTDIKYSDGIRTILELFARDLKNVSSICGEDYFTFVRKLMVTRKPGVNFKQQIFTLLIRVLEDVGYKEKYTSLTRQTQFLTNLYLAYYLTMVMRNTICFSG